MTEVWRAIPGYEGSYEVSNAGRVRSLNRRVRTGSGTRPLVGQILSPAAKNTGRLQVRLSRNGVHENRTVHRLVALAFLGEGGPGEEVCHNNGDYLDNRVENLRWDSRSENARDEVRLGRHYKAMRTECANGHPWTEESTYWTPEGYRKCRTCLRDRRRSNPSLSQRSRRQRRETCALCGKELYPGTLRRHERTHREPVDQEPQDSEDGEQL